MKKIKKIVLLSTIMLINSLILPVSAATTIHTDEFGDFTYYIHASGNGIGASTSITKPSMEVLLRTYEEMLDNATGELIAWDEDSAHGISKAYTLLWKPEDVDKVAAFATHEARGYGSIARYTSTTL